MCVGKSQVDRLRLSSKHISLSCEIHLNFGDGYSVATASAMDTLTLEAAKAHGRKLTVEGITEFFIAGSNHLTGDLITDTSAQSRTPRACCAHSAKNAHAIKLIKCSACGNAYYGGNECQKKLLLAFNL